MERPLEVRRSGEEQLLRRIDVLEVVLRAEPMELVGVGIGSRARIERNLDLLEGLLGPLDGAVEFPGVRHHQIHDEGALPLLGEDVVEVDVLLEVRIAAWPRARGFLLGGSSSAGRSRDS